MQGTSHQNAKKKRKKIRTNNKKLNDEQTNETTSQDKKTIFYPRTERKGSLTTQPSTQAINGRQFMKCVLHLSITRSGTMQKKKKKKEQQRRLLTYQENGQKRRPDRETDRPKKIRRPAGWWKTRNCQVPLFSSDQESKQHHIRQGAVPYPSQYRQ